MASYKFAFDVDAEVRIKATGRKGWVTSIMVGRRKDVQFLVQPAAETGERPPAEGWYTPDALEVPETPE